MTLRLLTRGKRNRRDIFMDISNWNMNQIMQLPDHVFGAQQCVGEYIGSNADEFVYFKISDSLPDWFVVWSILVEAEKAAATTWVNLTLRLGDSDTVPDDIRALDRLFEYKSSPEQLYEFHLPAVGLKHITGLRHLVNGKGRHIVGGLKMRSETGPVESMVSVFITPIPQEAPDWLIKV